MSNAIFKVKNRLYSGNGTVNGRSAGGSTLYQDLCALVADYERLSKLNTELAATVKHFAWPIENQPYPQQQRTYA